MTVLYLPGAGHEYQKKPIQHAAGQGALTRLGLYSPALAAENEVVSECTHKSHTVTVQIYHLVFPAKYSPGVDDKEVRGSLCANCKTFKTRTGIT